MTIKLVFNVNVDQKEVAKMAISKKLMIIAVIGVIKIDTCKSEYKLKKFMMMEIYDGIEMPRVIKTSTERK